MCAAGGNVKPWGAVVACRRSGGDVTPSGVWLTDMSAV